MQVVVEGHLHDPDLHLLHQLRRGEESGVILEETACWIYGTCICSVCSLNSSGTSRSTLLAFF